MGVKIKCPHCEKKFPWDMATYGWPKTCPLCDTWVGVDRADDDIVAPTIRTTRSQSIDKVYTDIEKGSEFRVQAAAEMAGTSVEDMASLKITNLRNAKEGETAAIPVSNPVTQHMEMMNSQGAQFGFQGANGLAHSAGVATGPIPNAGAHAMTSLRDHHASISHGSAVSDRPAVETQQPGYRRRA